MVEQTKKSHMGELAQEHHLNQVGFSDYNINSY